MLLLTLLSLIVISEAVSKDARPTCIQSDILEWYPGVELFGEGIFLDFAPSVDPHGYHFPLKHAESWFAAWRSPEKYHQRIQQTDENDYLHPVSVCSYPKPHVNIGIPVWTEPS